MVSGNVRDTYPLLLCGYKSLETRGDAETQLVNEGGFCLAVDLHPHTCLEGGILCKEDRWKHPVTIYSVNKQIQEGNFKCHMLFGWFSSGNKGADESCLHSADAVAESQKWNLLAMHSGPFD